MLYSAYGLTIQSALPLPELLPRQAGGVQAPDVQIRIASVPPDGLADGQPLGEYYWASAHSVWMQIPNVGRFQVLKGCEILVDPQPDVDQDSIRVFLLGSAFGALLFQRGHLVLHGNAIRIGDHCLVCVGHSGAGKSTLAAGFMRRGYAVLADDVVPVDDQCRALPGFPRIKLWQDVADQLMIDTSNLRRIRPSIEKFNLPVSAQDLSTPLPIRWVYILNRDDGDGIRIEPIRGMQRFQALREDTYMPHFLDATGQKSEHLKRCGKLAGTARLARITRPQDGFHLDPMVDAILADIAN